MKLTIGMATYDDFSGVYFSIQALRMYHDLTDIELLVVDNHGDQHLENWIKSWCQGKVRYEKYTDVTGTTMPRHMVFELAKGEYTYCIDSHVLLMPGSLDKFWETDDLVHGIMYYDCLLTPVTHMRSEWRADMWGVWECVDPIPKEPFEIPMHGLGFFGCRTDSWLGFNSNFKGFGGEEGYIHEKFRQAGRKVMCLPWIKWIHKFKKSAPYPLKTEDRIRNYLLGFTELNLDKTPIYQHFGINIVDNIVEKMNENTTNR